MTIPESTLKKRTIELFTALPRTVTNKEVAIATGLSITWVHDFTKGRIKEPSVDKIQHLYEYLAKKPLEL